MALLWNKFIVDGIHHEFLPATFEQIEDDYGVHRQSTPTVDLGRIVVVNQPTEDTLNPYIEKRKLFRQAWKVSWTEDTFMSRCMFDHLKTLYTLQKSVWMQYDDVMTREAANLFTIGNEYRSYFTPTYPIAPYGYEPTNPTTYPGFVFINYNAQASGFTVDSDVGMVRFDTALLESSSVIMAYTWKAFVQITFFDCHAIDVSDETFVGTVVFEQIRPNYTYDPWNITLGCGDIEYNAASGGFIWVTQQLTIPSNPTQISYNDSRWSLGTLPGITLPTGGVSGFSNPSSASILTQNTEGSSGSASSPPPLTNVATQPTI